MKPVSGKEAQFIREHGLKKAREVVEGAPDWASHFNEAIGYTESNDEYRGGFVKFINAKGQSDLSSKHELGVGLSDLKRLVESVMIITKTGGVSLVKDWFKRNGNAPLHQKYLSFNGISRIYCFSTDRYGGVHARRVKQAIHDYESIYGGGENA